MAECEGDAERSLVTGGAKCVPAEFGGCGVFGVFKDAEVCGEEDRFGLRASDPVFIVVFPGIRLVPLESGFALDLRKNCWNILRSLR